MSSAKTFRIGELMRELANTSWIGEQINLLSRELDEFDMPGAVEQLDAFINDAELFSSQIKELREVLVSQCRLVADK